MTDEPKNPEAVAPEDVQAYLRKRRAQFEDKKELATEHGETKVEFVEGTGFNKTALNFCERLDRFSPEVRQDVLRSLDLIRVAMDGAWAQEETAEMDFSGGGDERDPAERTRQARTSANRDGAGDDDAEQDLLDGPPGSKAFEAAKRKVAEKNKRKRENRVADMSAKKDMREVVRDLNSQADAELEAAEAGDR